MDRLASIKIKLIDSGGNPYYSEPILLKVDVQQVSWRDTSDTLYDMLGDIDLATKGPVQTQLTSIQTQIADARIDNLGTTWDSLGKSIRGQIKGVKAYLTTSGEIARLVSSEADRKWNGGNTPVSAAGYTAFEMEFSSITPTKIYVRTKWDSNDDSGICAEYWCYGPNRRTQHDTTLLNGEFKTITLDEGITNIRFNCATAYKESAMVTCANRTYELRESERDNTTKVLRKILNETAASSARQGSFIVTDNTSGNNNLMSINLSANEGDILHIYTEDGGFRNSNPTTIYIGGDNSNTFKQTLYSMIGEEKPNIDTYAVINNYGAQGTKIWLSYQPVGSQQVNGTIRVDKITLPIKRSETELGSGMKWINGETIYRKVYKGRCKTTNDGNGYTLPSVTLDLEWNYKYTIINTEVTVTQKNNYRARNQIINTCNVQNNNQSNLTGRFRGVYVYDAYSGGGQTDTSERANDNCELKFFPSSLVGDWSQITENKYFYYNITVYYIKNSYTIFPSLDKFSSTGLWANEDSGIKVTLPFYETEDDVFHPITTLNPIKCNAITLYLNEQKACSIVSEQPVVTRPLSNSVDVRLSVGKMVNNTFTSLKETVVTLDKDLTASEWLNGIHLDTTTVSEDNFYLQIAIKNNSHGYKQVIYLDAIEFDNITLDSL